MKKTRLLGPALVAGAVLTGALLVPSIVNAQEDAPSVEVPAEVSPDFETDVDLGIEDEFTPEDLAAFNAETDEIAAELEAAGIPVTVTEEDGFRFLEFPAELTEEQEAALSDIFGEPFELTEEDIAEFNAETQELVDALAAAGVTVDVTTDDDGFVDFEIPEDLTEEQLAAVDSVFEEFFDCPEDEGDHTDDTGADEADL